MKLRPINLSYFICFCIWTFFWASFVRLLWVDNCRFTEQMRKQYRGKLTFLLKYFFDLSLHYWKYCANASRLSSHFTLSTDKLNSPSKPDENDSIRWARLNFHPDVRLSSRLFFLNFHNWKLLWAVAVWPTCRESQFPLFLRQKKFFSSNGK